jgi:hypothetical protein
MKPYLTALILSLGIAASAYAAPAAARHFAVIDTVGNCAVIDTHPSKVDGLKILGDQAGYGSVQAAQKALGSHCKSKIDRI